MKKYIAQVAALNPFMWGTEAHKNFNETVEMKIVVTEDGRVFTKKDKSYTSVGRTPHSAGGKWGEVNLRYKTPGHYLRQVGAKEASFRGAPRGIK